MESDTCAVLFFFGVCSNSRAGPCHLANAHIIPKFLGGHMKDRLRGLHLLIDLKRGNNRADIDTGSLVFISALIHKSAFVASNFLLAVREFQRRIIILIHIHKWKCNFIFDGVPPPEKKFEHAFRQEKKDTVPITSTYIAMCKNVCKRIFVD